MLASHFTGVTVFLVMMLMLTMLVLCLKKNKQQQQSNGSDGKSKSWKEGSSFSGSFVGSEPFSPAMSNEFLSRDLEEEERALRAKSDKDRAYLYKKVWLVNAMPDRHTGLSSPVSLYILHIINSATSTRTALRSRSLGA